MPMKIGPVHARIAADVFSPRAVWASSQMTIVYAELISPAWRTNHWYVSTVTGPRLFRSLTGSSPLSSGGLSRSL